MVRCIALNSLGSFRETGGFMDAEIEGSKVRIKSVQEDFLAKKSPFSLKLRGFGTENTRVRWHSHPSGFSYSEQDRSQMLSDLKMNLNADEPGKNVLVAIASVSFGPQLLVGVAFYMAKVKLEYSERDAEIEFCDEVKPEHKRGLVAGVRFKGKYLIADLLKYTAHKLLPKSLVLGVYSKGSETLDKELLVAHFFKATGLRRFLLLRFEGSSFQAKEVEIESRDVGFEVVGVPCILENTGLSKGPQESPG
jgi:hypothetical protein